MATANEGSALVYTAVVAGGDLSAKQYHFVKWSAANTVVACDGITDIPCGVLLDNPDTAGMACQVAYIGEVKVVADGTLTIGQLIGTSADGQADAIAAGTDTTVYTVGTAKDTASAGDYVNLVINCAAPARAA